MNITLINMETPDDTANHTNVTHVGAGDENLSTFAMVMIISQLILMIVIVGANTLVLTALWKFHSLRDITAIFVANLAISDLITGLVMPYQVAFFFYPPLERNKQACILRFLVISFACNASIYSLVCAVFDRLMIITNPLRYPEIMTRKLAFGMVISIWITDIIFHSIPLLGANNYDTSPICLFELVINKWHRFFNFVSGLVCALCMFVMYIKIFCIVRSQLLRIHADVPELTAHQSKRTQQMNAAVAIVVLVFHISWLPFFITELTMLDLENVTVEKVLVANFCVFAGVFNSVLNPIVYAWKNKQYRRAFRRLLSRQMSNENLSVLPTT